MFCGSFLLVFMEGELYDHWSCQIIIDGSNRTDRSKLFDAVVALPVHSVELSSVYTM